MSFLDQPLVVVVLAAGASTRLGQPKQSLLFEGQSLLRRAVGTALAAQLGPVAVVLGAHQAQLDPQLAGLPATRLANPHWAEGLASSVRLGGQWADGQRADGVLFILCDQPHVTPALLQQLQAQWLASGRPLVASQYANGQQGVPLLVARPLFAELAQLQGDAGAKKLLAQHPNLVATVPFALGQVDVDTPADYARLLASGPPPVG
jgi:molybdenum cofactor cytidylyltransferase